MRLIDADALKADHFVTSTTTNTPLYRYVSMKQIANAPTVEPASPWHSVEEPPKKDGAYAVWWNYKGASYWFRGVFFDGRWLFEPGTPKPDYWMPIEPPKEDA